MHRLPLLFTLRFTLLSLLPASALAWGPAVHLREADAVLARVLDAHPEWAARFDAHPTAYAWMQLGALSPDFQWLTDALPFGHGKALSDHLLDAAPADRPELAFFALGHLAHNTSDAVAETFFSPHVWSSHPMGYVDLLAGVHDDGQGEVEFVCEALGDLELGHWDPVVDVLYDFYLEGPEAEALGASALQWYCAEGAAFTGQPLDCDRVTEAVLSRLGAADEILNGASRAVAKRLINALLDQPLDVLVSVALDGPLASVFGGRQGDGPSATYEWEMARLVSGPVLDEAFWAHYEAEGFDALSAIWAEAHLRHRSVGFPSWDPNALVSANWVSSLRLGSGPEYAGHAGIIVDDVRWAVDGAPAGSVAAGQDASVTVQMFAAVRFEGVVHAKVHADVLDAQGEGPVVAEAEVAIAVDPADYGTVDRTTVTVPFRAEAEGARGYFVTLHHGGDARPFFTTNALAIWGRGVPGGHRPAARAAFQTYGVPFPGSLAAEGGPAEGLVAVSATFAHAAVPLAGVTASAGGVEATTGPSGVALLRLPVGPGEISVAPPLAGAVEVHPVEVAPHALTWLDVTVDDVPVEVTVPAYAPPCIPVTATMPLLGPDAVIAWLGAFVDEAGAPLDARRPLVDGALCGEVPDGEVVHLEITPSFGRHGVAPSVVVGPVVVDGSAPTWETIRLESAAPVCPHPRVFRPAATLVLDAADPHSPLGEATWSLDGGPWQPLTLGEALAIPEGAEPVWIQAQVVNAAGLMGPISVTIEPSDQGICPPDTGVVDAGVADAAMADASAEVVAETPRTDDGCRSTPLGAPGHAALLVLAFGLGWRRRRRSR